MTIRTLPWVAEIVLEGTGPGRVLLFAGFGSGPEPLRELAESIRARTNATVVVSALSRHDGDPRAFHSSRSWHYVDAAEQRFLALADDGDGPLVIGGYSTGALVALLIMARHPARVAGLVLVSPALRLSRADRQAVAYTVVSAYYLLLPSALLGTMLAVAWHGRKRRWPRGRSMLAVMGSAAIFASATLGLRALTVPLAEGGPVIRDGEEVLPPHFTRASLLAGSSLVPLQLLARWRLRGLERPVCFVFGEQDTVVDVRFGTLRATQTRAAELHLIPDAPHRVASLERCREVVSEFVQRVLATPIAPRH